jgi:hypothetical protein
MFRIPKALRILLLVACCFSLLPLSAFAEEKVWRVLYVEGGPFSNYQNTLAHTARGLEKLGLIDNGQVTVPANSESSLEMWQWLSENAKGRIQFLRDGHYSAEWDGAS